MKGRLVTQFTQPTVRSWSQWVWCGGYIICCDCGSTHRIQYAERTVKGKPRLYYRVRVHKGRTAARRKRKVHKCQPVRGRHD